MSQKIRSIWGYEIILPEQRTVKFCQSKLVTLRPSPNEDILIIQEVAIVGVDRSEILTYGVTDPYEKWIELFFQPVAAGIMIASMTANAQSPPTIDQIIRSDRRSFSLEITRDGRLIVRAPRHATLAQIESVVSRKADWIVKKQAQCRNRSADWQPKTFTPGETFWYLGEQYPLQIVNHRQPLLELDGRFRLAKSAQGRAKEIFINWFREETRAITTALIAKYAAAHRFNVRSVRITSARTRWGSCSGKNTLNFTYRLCMAPLPVMEYVVVHELAHLRVHNHSQMFWQAVAGLMPEYQTHRDWLRRHGHLLTLE